MALDPVDRTRADLRHPNGRSRLLDVIPDLVFAVTVDGTLVEIAGGGDGAEVVAALPGPIGTLLPAPLVAGTLAAIQRVQGGAGAQTFEYEVPGHGGSRWYEARLIAIPDGLFAGAVRESTARKRAEDRLAESERRFRAMADGAPVLLWMAGTDAECEFFNRGWLRFTGEALESEVGVGWAARVHFEDFQHCMHVYLDAFVARRPFRMEYRLRRADGSYRWILDEGHPRLTPDGDFAGYIGSCIDITELKELQLDLDRRVRERTAQLEASLAERETLLYEIHHRVKNNLQVISSLLNLQAAYEGTQEHGEALAESQSRILSIALVHERLYLSKNLAKVEFDDYVRGLAGNIVHAFGRGSQVEVRLDLAPLLLPVDQAIPCGLIINELVTNALKYAFPDQRRGAVDIRLTESGRHVLLEVKDDGVGLAGDIDLRNPTTLGLNLVTTLTEQLEGHLEIVRSGGTVFRIHFEVGS